MEAMSGGEFMVSKKHEGEDSGHQEWKREGGFQQSVSFWREGSSKQFSPPQEEKRINHKVSGIKKRSEVERNQGVSATII